MGLLVIVAIIGLLPAAIAQSKGRNFVLWWLYGAGLFIVALPHALIMAPDRERVEQQQLGIGGTKKCPYCAELIKSEAIVCRFCTRELSPAPMAN